jgi:outer membrane lipoprotein-sorting protein
MIGFLVVVGYLYGLVCAQAPILPTRSRNQDDARKLLQQTGDTYRDMKSYYAEGVLLVQSLHVPVQPGDIDWNQLFIEAEVKPNKFRNEIRDARLGSTRVTDGLTSWHYKQQTNQYTKKPVAGGATADFPKGSEYERIGAGVASARVLREESLPVNGGDVTCYVIELIPERQPPADTITEPRLLWIGKANHLVLKDVSRSTFGASKRAGERATFTRVKVVNVVKVNQPLPDALFVFLPPEGAREVGALN